MSAPTDTPPSSPGGLRGNGRGRWGDPVFRWVTLLAGASVLVILGVMMGRTSWASLPVFQSEGVWGFLTGDLWSTGQSRSEVTGDYGALPFIYGTIKVSIIAIVIAVPMAVAIALFINEVAPAWLRKPLAYLTDTLAMVPSIVIAIVAVFWFIPNVTDPIARFLVDTPLGWLPLFEGPAQRLSYWSAGLMLSIMILPIITAVTRETFAKTPADEKNAAYAMGATRWEVMRGVILPRGFPGLVGGTMLGVGRALGETIVVAFTVGSSQRMDSSVFFGGDTITAVIFNTYATASPEAIWGLLALGVTLFVMTTIVNVLARLIVMRSGRVAGDAAV
ncbi:phosphate ABC transporter permease subunit PstC [Egibacter rhizosphaerae]|uniref:Phosphate transport system permease protein n=1 Tax=Egibacter rhizosphaerae TaxID=1670831 RepID=A0A411YJ59_9ACTN|nr:phosphate ABC transporter permease subunit PstC [Egibacter rhizosphaerae]QBI21159.1 phosphate ABC transporter permease subunit PstC [Egibacter rhizosphaerae]